MVGHIDKAVFSQLQFAMVGFPNPANALLAIPHEGTVSLVRAQIQEIPILYRQLVPIPKYTVLSQEQLSIAGLEDHLDVLTDKDWSLGAMIVRNAERWGTTFEEKLDRAAMMYVAFFEDSRRYKDTSPQMFN